MADTIPHLPPSKYHQPYYDVSALEGGALTLKDKVLVPGVDDSDQHVVPTLAFLLTHIPSGKRLLIDLGMSLDEDSPSVTPEIKKLAITLGSGLDTSKDVIKSLKAGGLGPQDITHVFLSHVHFDHVGNPAKFGKARFSVGGGGLELLKQGYPEDPKSSFHSLLLPKDRTESLDAHAADWKPVGPFKRALDYFDDGSLYIVDAPGHLPGHLNFLARTSADGGWIYLAGDSAHDWRLIRGQADIAVLDVPIHGMSCIHTDPAEARKTIRKIADLLTLPRVRVILAYDNEWYEDNKGGDAFFPGKDTVAVVVHSFTVGL